MDNAIEVRMESVLGTYCQCVERDNKESKMGIEELGITFSKNLPAS
jgi:hypothetical protein